MPITSEQVTHIARLARLACNPTEAHAHAEQLSRILDLVEQMNHIDTDNIVPMSHPHEAALRLRDDQHDAGHDGGHDAQARREEYQRLAPATADGLYLAPKVMD